MDGLTIGQKWPVGKAEFEGSDGRSGVHPSARCFTSFVTRPSADERRQRPQPKWPRRLQGFVGTGLCCSVGASGGRSFSSARCSLPKGRSGGVEGTRTSRSVVGSCCSGG